LIYDLILIIFLKKDMNSKEFKIWLDGFLTPLNLGDLKIRKELGVGYNHLTMLKTIHDKLKNVKDLEEVESKSINTLLTERIIPVEPPNPFTIRCEKKD
jgi:hypothetical protein|tara:strand:- start:1296 stop:1592 length:297 start_codon:yes stop_codon:yes gene_type:complete